MKIILIFFITFFIFIQAQSATASSIQYDKSVYAWTDLVHITVYAPDFNSDPNVVDTIDVSVSTRGQNLSPYKLAETGTDTGMFIGNVTLTGDPLIKGSGGVDGEGTNPSGALAGIGPTDGFLPAENDDGVTVSFEYSKDLTVTGSALIKWNVGQIMWIRSNYQPNGYGLLQIVDPDMNLNPKAIDKFDANVWSDSDSGGTKIAMMETGKNTGMFEGKVDFTNTFQSSGEILHVEDGDTVTGEYIDRTLPAPHSPQDELHLTAMATIGTASANDKVQASNVRIVDTFGNELNSIKVNQQVMIATDLINAQQKAQPFAYLVQIEDSQGVTVSLSWITGSFSPGQSFEPSQSWIPTEKGVYTVQIFVWQSVKDPEPLSHPLWTTLKIS